MAEGDKQGTTTVYQQKLLVMSRENEELKAQIEHLQQLLGERERSAVTVKELNQKSEELKAQVEHLQQMLKDRPTITAPHVDPVRDVHTSDTSTTHDQRNDLSDPITGTALVEAIQTVIPRDSTDTHRKIHPLSKSDTGVSLEYWVKQINEECKYRRIHLDREKIVYALNHTDATIHTSFRVIDPGSCTWDQFISMMRKILPKTDVPQDFEYLPKTGKLIRLRNQTWKDFCLSELFLECWSELCKIDSSMTPTTFQKILLLNALGRVTPAEATRKWIMNDGYKTSWNSNELDKVGKLCQILDIVSQWVERHPGEDTRFAENLPYEQKKSKEETISVVVPQKVKCDFHGLGNHSSLECRILNNPTFMRGNNRGNRPRGRRGRGQNPIIPQNSETSSHGTMAIGNYGRGRLQHRGRGQHRVRGANSRVKNNPTGCFTCGELGHIARDCPDRKDNKNQTPKNEEVQDAPPKK